MNTKLILYAFYGVILVLMIMTFIGALKRVKDDGYTYLGFLKQIYLKSFKSYVYGFLLAISFISTLLFIMIYFKDSLPKFLTWSWLSIFDQQSTNVIGKPIIASSQLDGMYKIIYLGSLWILLFLIMPVLAYNEEVSFRSYNFSIKDRIKSSLLFSVIHFPMGVNLLILIILFLFGLLMSYLYVKKYDKCVSDDFVVIDTINMGIYARANSEATLHVGRIHTLYNMSLITLLVVCLMVI